MPIRAQVKKPAAGQTKDWVKGDKSVPDHWYSVGVRSSQHPGTMSLVSEAGVRILSEEEGEANGRIRCQICMSNLHRTADEVGNTTEQSGSVEGPLMTYCSESSLQISPSFDELMSASC